MKVQTGRYDSQIAFGVTLLSYYGDYKALVFDFGLWYIELIFKNNR